MAVWLSGHTDGGALVDFALLRHIVVNLDERSVPFGVYQFSSRPLLPDPDHVATGVSKCRDPDPLRRREV